MYINPILVGVIGTLAVEFGIIIIGLIYIGISGRRDD